MPSNTKPAAKRIRLDYYAVFRETRGCADESVETTAETVLDLYTELQLLHGFPWPVETLRVALNDEFCAWTAPIQEGDCLVFIAPVAGG